VDDTAVINFLLSTEIIPLCLRTMELGSELSKTVATFIVQKILLDDVGLSYICATAERCYAVGAVLGSMVVMLQEQPSVRLLKHVVRCYLRLSDNARYVHTFSSLPHSSCFIFGFFFFSELYNNVVSVAVALSSCFFDGYDCLMSSFLHHFHSHEYTIKSFTLP
jgi:hypothetical protein